MGRVAGLMAVMVAAGAMGLPGVARADEASKRAKVEEFFTILHMDRTMEQILTGVQAQTNSMLQSMPGYDKLTPEQHKLTTDFQAKVQTMVQQSLGWHALEPEMVKLYANTYTEAELDGLLAFYKSAVGQSMLAKTPELTKASMAISQEKMRALSPQMQGMLQDYMKQMSALQLHTGAAQEKKGPA